MELKYIITNTNEYAIFSTGNSHDDIARGMYGTPVSAGFLHLEISAKFEDGIIQDTNETVLKTRCYGESISLHIISKHEEDDKFFYRKLNSFDD